MPRVSWRCWQGIRLPREPRRNFSQSNNDVFVTLEVVRKHALRDGMWIKGETRRGSRGPQLFKLVEIEGRDPDNFRIFPFSRNLPRSVQTSASVSRRSPIAIPRA